MWPLGALPPLLEDWQVRKEKGKAGKWLLEPLPRAVPVSGGMGLVLPRTGAQSSPGTPPWLSPQGLPLTHGKGVPGLALCIKWRGQDGAPGLSPLGLLGPHSGLQLMPLSHRLAGTGDHVLPVFHLPRPTLPGQVDLRRRKGEGCVNTESGVCLLPQLWETWASYPVAVPIIQAGGTLLPFPQPDPPLRSLLACLTVGVLTEQASALPLRGGGTFPSLQLFSARRSRGSPCPIDSVQPGPSAPLSLWSWSRSWSLGVAAGKGAAVCPLDSGNASQHRTHSPEQSREHSRGRFWASRG